ncbi:acyl-CoA N-acyltransferase [Meredithblackwellia eburnea MCA 4105]
MSSKITLHPVTAQNASHSIPSILRLIRNLAVFEKEPVETVKATEQLLFRNLGFEAAGEGDKHKYAECVLAWDGGAPGDEGAKAVGMALYFFTFSTWTGKGGLYLEDLYVEESHRGQGIAKVLFRYLGQVCVEKDLARMDWVVLSWNQGAKDVYKKLGAVQGEGWDRMRLEGEALTRLAQ